MKRILMVLAVGIFGAAAIVACGDKKPPTDPSTTGAPTSTDTAGAVPSTPSTDTAAPSVSAPTVP